MGDDRHSPRPGDQPDGRERIRRVVRLVVPLARMQDAVERLRPIADDAAGDEGVCDVRAADRGICRRLCEHIRPRQFVVAADVADDALGATDPVVADAVGLGAQRRVLGIEQVPEHVHAAPLVLRRQFHARDECHAEGCRDLCRLVPSGRAIVVGEGECANAVRVRLTDDLSGALGAVGVVRVQMQIVGSCEHRHVGHDPTILPQTRAGAEAPRQVIHSVRP